MGSIRMSPLPTKDPRIIRFSDYKRDLCVFGVQKMTKMMIHNLLRQCHISRIPQNRIVFLTGKHLSRSRKKFSYSFPISLFVYAKKTFQIHTNKYNICVENSELLFSFVVLSLNYLIVFAIQNFLQLQHFKKHLSSRW